MAQKSKPQTPHKSSYRGFEGVDLKKTHSGDESIALIENFRISDDGSLKKRCGFKHVYMNNNGINQIHASFSLEENGIEVCYFAQGKYVKKYDSATTSVIDVGTLHEEASRVFFFTYLDKLYVCDGYTIFKIEDNQICDANFYIPLYGKDWNAFGGEVNELPNLLWPKIAIHYNFSDNPSTYLSLTSLNVSSVDAVFRNGEPLSKNQYSIHQEYNSITVPECVAGDVFLAIINITPTEEYISQRETLFNTSHTSIFPELNENNLLFWGSNRSNAVYYSTCINKENAAITDRYINNVRFYVPLNSFFTVASESDRIKAFVRHYDRVLIMTENSTWITSLDDLESKSLKIKSINSDIGCIVDNGCVRIENTIFSVGKDAIYAWSSDTDELNECNAYSISNPIKALLSENFFKGCLIHLNYSEREIWFYAPNEGRVWIYSYNRKAWYSFSGFSPTAFLDGGKSVRFFENAELLAFDDSKYTDIRRGQESEIIAKLTSGELEFNSRFKKKLSSTIVKGSFSGGSLRLESLLDGKKRIVYYISPRSTHSINLFRTKSGSFSSLSFDLIARGKGTQIIHGIEINAD